MVKGSGKLQRRNHLIYVRRKRPAKRKLYSNSLSREKTKKSVASKKRQTSLGTTGSRATKPEARESPGTENGGSDTWLPELGLPGHTHSPCAALSKAAHRELGLQASLRQELSTAHPEPAPLTSHLVSLPHTSQAQTPPRAAPGPERKLHNCQTGRKCKQKRKYDGTDKWPNAQLWGGAVRAGRAGAGIRASTGASSGPAGAQEGWLVPSPYTDSNLQPLTPTAAARSPSGSADWQTGQEMAPVRPHKALTLF